MVIHSVDEPKLAGLITLAGQWQTVVEGAGAKLLQINCSLDGTIEGSVILAWNAAGGDWDITTM